ncbi:MAG TPA: hypothetical protein VG892_10365 [Terriglobales bacterium]|nr:hypothetical protein [Terriglobales bacterium]
MQSIYEVLKEKEAQLHELQRLLNEAQSVLGRVLELDALSGNESPAAPSRRLLQWPGTARQPR